MPDESIHDGMARAIVTVISVDGQKAIVDATASGGCASCAGSKGCGTRTLLAFFGSRSAPLKVDNILGARAGDQLEIGIEQSKILKLSAVSYLLPLIGLVGGGLAGDISTGSNLVSFGLALLGLFAGFAYGRYLFTSSRWESELSPVCLRRVSSGKEKYIDPEVVH